VSNFSFLGESISKLENTKIPLSESIQIIDLSISKINESVGPTAELIKNKMNVVLNKNSGLKTIKCIRNILCGIVDEDTMELNLSPSEITAMKYAPITSCDVERSFSRYKSVFRPNRR
jgi:division protein CdvB (Snf7/Vps24/ESCRT-III family)